MSRPVPIETLHLFPEIDALLIDFLGNLSPAEWEQQTLAPRWKVMDVALHLLDGNLRTLSMLRDGHFGIAPQTDLGTHTGLVSFLNQLNADWITATRRLSPEVVVWLLEATGKEYSRFLSTLDPWAPAAFAVAWAGENESRNWFHVAREFTEKWHHQQQIRQAVGRGEEELLQPRFYGPYLQTSMHALPHHYRAVEAPAGTVLRVTVTGPGAQEWHLHRSTDKWMLGEFVVDPVTSIEVDGAVMWQLLSKELTSAEQYVRITGDQRLGEPIRKLTAVMA
ncbi:maleylpyruvate isomerase N-terminal domain-containing protein [Hymenobacter koreensis]|uniref:Mycothiol-dependent maleylpyruvate isomerase metal-binding domain-containing protein n=1 Tax=Hymenobacter koreensis TaxID=1084523 RepID=A0ABP8J7G8_9BACT